ncbi:hypothetical protein [Spirosoma aerophilum]
MKIFAKVMAIGGGIALLLVLWNWLWHAPEIWNATAARYKVRGDSLQREATMLFGLNATKDSVIMDISSRWKDAIAYGDKWKADLVKQYALNDELAEKLSQPEQEQQNFLGLQQNGTLDKSLDTKTLTPGDGRVVLANLKTVKRQETAVKTLDSVSRVIGVLTVKTDRMGKTLKRTDASLGALSVDLRKQAKKARFLFIKTKASKQLSQAATTVDSIQADVRRESKLEKYLNQD